MKVIKKNQIVIFAIALMLITAGYLNFVDTNSTDIQTSADTFGDAMLVSSSASTENENTIEASNKVYAESISDAVSSKNTKEAEKIVTEKINEDEYFANTKIERDSMYSQMIDSYQKMISEDSFSAEQKAIAQNEITKINNTKNAIMITENLIKMKGFDDVVVLVNDESINIVVSKDKLIHEEVAQIQNIVSREMKAEIENIHIVNK